MKNSEAIKLLADYGIPADLAHELISELGDALKLEPEIVPISAHVVRVQPENSVM